MVKSVPKQMKVLKVSKEKVQTSSSSSTSSSLSSLAPSSVFQCSPPLQSNGAKVAKVPLLNSDEQKMYTKHFDHTEERFMFSRATFYVTDSSTNTWMC
jgi:hypothetical protein